MKLSRSRSPSATFARRFSLAQYVFTPRVVIWVPLLSFDVNFYIIRFVSFVFQLKSSTRTRRLSSQTYKRCSRTPASSTWKARRCTSTRIASRRRSKSVAACSPRLTKSSSTIPQAHRFGRAPVPGVSIRSRRVATRRCCASAASRAAYSAQVDKVLVQNRISIRVLQ